jgi:hypothetical protein
MSDTLSAKDIILGWFFDGEVGASSRLLAEYILGRDVNPNGNFLRMKHPHDPDDCRRCTLLLQRLSGHETNWQGIAAIVPGWTEWIPEIERQLAEGPMTQMQWRQYWADQRMTKEATR